MSSLIDWANKQIEGFAAPHPDNRQFNVSASISIEAGVGQMLVLTIEATQLERVRMADLKAGDVLIADAGFSCIPEGEVIVNGDEAGLYFECAEGRHRLDGQEDEPGGYLSGLTRRPT